MSFKMFGLILLIILSLVGLASAAALTFTKPVPNATHGTLGVNQQLEMSKAAIEEIKTKMENWAAFTGYSTGTGR